MKYQSIAESIIQLKNEDLTFRASLIEKGELNNGYNSEMERLHIRNAQAFEKIINEIGYPTYRKVGKEASDAPLRKKVF